MNDIQLKRIEISFCRKCKYFYVSAFTDKYCDKGNSGGYNFKKKQEKCKGKNYKELLKKSFREELL